MRGPSAAEPTGRAAAPAVTTPGFAATAVTSFEGLPVSASDSSPSPASRFPAVKMGLALPVWITQSTGAETNGADFPLLSLSASPAEMFSTRTVKRTARPVPCPSMPGPVHAVPPLVQPTGGY